MNHRQRETLRRRYRPAQVRLLFVGESPPASGRFFYRGDSGLYRAMRDTFREIDPEITDANFLTRFRDSGYYLVDLCPEPVDGLSGEQRRAACRGSETALARMIVRLRPLAIATVVRSIESIVVQAASRAEWHGPLIHLPYPGRWSHHRIAFSAALKPHLTQAEIVLS